MGVLSRVVLLEAAVPLVAATVVAAGIAYWTSVMAVLRLAPAGTAIRTMTAPSTIRFE